MKITVIGPTSPYKGGISHYNTIFCKELAKKHNIQAISFSRQYPNLLFPGKEQKDKESEEKISFEAKELIDSINPFTWIKTAKAIQKFKPRLILMYWWTPYFTFNFLTISYLAKKLTNAKIVFLCHNVAPHEARFIDRILTKIGLSQSNAYIVHAQKEKELLLDIFPKANVIKHVHPIYDIFKEKFKEKDISDLKLRKKILLFFGFIRKYKGLDFLIKAMPDLVKEFPDLDLLVVGEFWDDAKDQKELIEQSPVKNHIKVIEDYIPNEIVGNYFKACDICVLPYRSATNSGIVQTAFAFHKPCVVTRVGGLPEVVLDKKTGYVIEPKSTKEIIKVVTEYYKENKQKEFEQNVINDLDRFSWDKLVKVLENTLK